MAIATPGFAATAETENFVVSAKSVEVAAAVAEAAEETRASLAREWLGGELDDSRRCGVAAPRLEVVGDQP